jgi:uncharacterized repeat protein (TIGR01451 family)
MTDTADVSVTCTDSTDPIVADNTLTYTVTVHNNGPQTATDVRLLDALSPHVRLKSFTTTHGSLRGVGGQLVGYLGTLASGASATVTLVVTPTEGSGQFDAEGEQITNGVMVRAEQIDNVIANNAFAESTKILPNPNKPPLVTITNLTDHQVFQGPGEIAINVTATDSDGSISLVQFGLDGQLVGELPGTGGSAYTATAHNVSPGRHKVFALAQDNGGRIAVTDEIEVIVNGPAFGEFKQSSNRVVIHTWLNNQFKRTGILSSGQYFEGNFLCQQLSRSPGNVVRRSLHSFLDECRQ